MAQPYVGEIRLFAGNFQPAGWNFCDGRLLPISENLTLFQLIGTTYGGDGQSTFALPDLRGRVPIHQGNGFVLAETGGAETIILTTSQIPAHSHPMLVSSAPANTSSPINNVLGQGRDIYAEQFSRSNLNSAAVSAVGGSQAHENMQPYVGIHFIISLFGMFPSAT